MQWDIVEIVVHDCSSFLYPPFQPFQPAPNLAQDPAVACMAFFFLCVLLCFSRLPRSREISSIKIDLEKKSLVMHLILMLMNPDVTRNSSLQEATSERWAIVIAHHLAEAKEMNIAR